MNNSKESNYTEMLTKENKGKYIICRTDEKSKTRHFICRVGIGANNRTKDGWWDTFTISKDECEPGYGLFQIHHFTTDKNDNIILIVNHVCKIGLESYRDLSSVGWIPIIATGLFAGWYYDTDELVHDRVNNEALEKLLTSKGAKKISDRNKTCFDMFKAGTVTFKEIKEALSEPQEWEKLLTAIKYSAVFEKGELWDTHPMLMSRFQTMWNFDKEWDPVAVIERIRDLCITASRDPKFADTDFSRDLDPIHNMRNCMDVAEWMCGRYKEINEEKKAAKKAARKAAKESA